MGVKVRTGDIARELGIMPSRVGFYTRFGLLKTKGETQGGQNLFDLEETKQRFKKIADLRKKRLTLNEIKKEFDKS